MNKSTIFNYSTLTTHTRCDHEGVHARVCVCPGLDLRPVDISFKRLITMLTLVSLLQAT